MPGKGGDMIAVIKTMLSFTGRDPNYTRVRDEIATQRADLDRRLLDLTRATLDHEGQWFLEIVRADPDCAVKVVSQCAELKPD